MRWPIQVQLLLSILLIVFVAVAMSSLGSAYVGSSQIRRQQEDRMRQVIETLTEARFPLTERVLEQMSSLSGTHFVLLDQGEQVVAATLALNPPELQQLRRIPPRATIGQFAANPTIDVGGHPHLNDRVPLHGRAALTERGTLAILYREDRWRDAARQAAYPALLAGAVSAAAAVLAASVLANRLVKPLKLLGDETAAIAGGSFRGVAVPRRNDEIRDLALSINNMTDKLSRYASEVRRTERLWTLGQLGAGMAHQLRNSATGARMDIELHRRECALTGENGQPLDVALRQLRLMETYLQRFLSLGRPRPSEHASIDLHDLVTDVLDLVRPACVHNRVALTCEGPREPLVVEGDADSLRELLTNLLLNAQEAATRNVDVPASVAVEVLRLDAGRAAVQIRDSGRGPALEIAGRLFEPFVSEKLEGTGLGLFVARQIVEAHGGAIEWRREGDMTCFTVELPLAE